MPLTYKQKFDVLPLRTRHLILMQFELWHTMRRNGPRLLEFEVKLHLVSERLLYTPKNKKEFREKINTNYNNHVRERGTSNGARSLSRGIRQ